LLLTLHQTYIHQTTIGRFRVSMKSDPDPPRASGLPAEVEAIALVPSADRTPEQSKSLEQFFLTVAPELAEANAEIAALQRSMPKFPTSMVLQERPALERRTTFVHRRGEFLRTAEPVEPGVPAVLPPLPAGIRPDRLALARWLVGEGRSRTARVIVNRLWQHHFGRGIIGTPSDFGNMGEPPSHPELLDWLACDLIDGDWALKRVHRQMVLSQAYRQAGIPRPEGVAADPENRLLWRANARRLSAEEIRDSLLCFSGRLNAEMGGPGALLPLPDGVAETAWSLGVLCTVEDKAPLLAELRRVVRDDAPVGFLVTVKYKKKYKL